VHEVAHVAEDLPVDLTSASTVEHTHDATDGVPGEGLTLKVKGLELAQRDGAAAILIVLVEELSDRINRSRLGHTVALRRHTVALRRHTIALRRHSVAGLTLRRHSVAGLTLRGHATLRRHSVARLAALRGHTIAGLTLRGHATLRRHSVAGLALRRHSVAGLTLRGHTIAGLTLRGHARLTLRSTRTLLIHC